MIVSTQNLWTVTVLLLSSIASVLSLNCYECLHMAVTVNGDDNLGVGAIMKTELEQSSSSACLKGYPEFQDEVGEQNAYRASCSSGVPGCYKLMGSMTLEYNYIFGILSMTVTMTDRGCYDMTGEETGCEENTPISQDFAAALSIFTVKNYAMEGCACDTDLCNAATTLSAGVLVALLGALLTLKALF